jgi:hypothetical protein
MRKVTTEIQLGKPDQNGDILMPGSIKTRKTNINFSDSDNWQIGIDYANGPDCTVHTIAVVEEGQVKPLVSVMIVNDRPVVSDEDAEFEIVEPKQLPAP